MAHHNLSQPISIVPIRKVTSSVFPITPWNLHCRTCPGSGVVTQNGMRIFSPLFENIISKIMNPSGTLFDRICGVTSHLRQSTTAACLVPCISGQIRLATFRFLSLIFVLFWQENLKKVFGSGLSRLGSILSWIDIPFFSAYKFCQYSIFL